MSKQASSAFGRGFPARHWTAVLTLMFFLAWALPLPALAAESQAMVAGEDPPLGPDGFWIGPGTTYQPAERRFGGSGNGLARGGIVRIDPDAALLTIEPSLAFGGLTERQRLSEQAAPFGRRVVAGVNGDFFYLLPEAPGAPVGLLIRNGELLSSGDGAAVGIDAEGQPIIGPVQWSGEVRVLAPDGSVVASRALCAVNKPRASDCLVLYTSAWGPSTRTNPWGAEAILLPDDPAMLPLRATSDITAQVRLLYRPGEGAGNAPLAPGTLVLSGHGAAGDFLAAQARPGSRVRIVLNINEPWHEVRHAMGGGPLLIADGRPLPLPDTDWARRPVARTAVGIDRQGRWLWMVVDGGQPGVSRGVSLAELTDWLLEAGAVAALNLDGGGSSTLLVRPPGEFAARVVSRPSDGSERPIGPAWLVLSDARPGAARYLWADPAMTRVLPQTPVTLRLRAQDEQHEPVAVDPDAVTWQVEPAGAAAQATPGRATVPDGAGGAVMPELQLTPGAPGKITVRASADGVEGAALARVDVLGPGDIARVEILPNPASLQPGQRVQLRAVAYDHEGAAIPAGRETFVWSGTGDFAGIAPTGELTVPEDHAAGRIEVGLKVTEDGQSRSLPVYSVHVVIGEAPAFRDMAGHWAAQVVAALASRGVIQGYPDGTFGPERSVTRAEFATLLVRGLRTERQLPDVGEPLPFADRDVIPAWAAGSIGVAARQGLLGGYEDGTFRPERPITREEAAVILSRLPEVAEVAPDPIAYTDADAISAWARLGVVLASGAGLVEGYPDGSFRPQAPITRAEAAALIERLLGVLQASS